MSLNPDSTVAENDYLVVSFSGTQLGMSAYQKQHFILLFADEQPDEFHHGDCVGADEQAHAMVRKYAPKCVIHAHPCDIDFKRAYCKADVVHPIKRPLARNTDLVVVCQTLIYAPFQLQEVQRSGTWATYRRAKALNRHLVFLRRKP